MNWEIVKRLAIIGLLALGATSAFLYAAWAISFEAFAIMVGVVAGIAAAVPASWFLLLVAGRHDGTQV